MSQIQFEVSLEDLTIIVMLNHMTAPMAYSKLRRSQTIVSFNATFEWCWRLKYASFLFSYSPIALAPANTRITLLISVYVCVVNDDKFINSRQIKIRFKISKDTLTLFLLPYSNLRKPTMCKTPFNQPVGFVK